MLSEMFSSVRVQHGWCERRIVGFPGYRSLGLDGKGKTERCFIPCRL